MVRILLIVSLVFISMQNADAACGVPLEIVDGDTVRVDGAEWRLRGFDTPEHSPRAKCDAERRLAEIAKRRLQQIVDGCSTLATVASGTKDRYGRELGDLIVDGRNVREPLLEECLARPYNGGKRNGWCSDESLSEQPCKK